MDKQTFFTLIDKYQDGTATPAEKSLVEEYYRRLEATGTTELSAEEEAALKETMFGQIAEGIKEPVVRKMPVWKRVAAAAAIIGLIATGSYFMFFNKLPTATTEVAASNPAEIKAPSSTNAVITLSNGEQIMLDNAANGQLTSQGNVTIKKMADGQIAYIGTSGELIYNTLTNPRGSQVVSLTLADGSKAFLNAGSSLKYPVAFTGNSREVELTGEGYFEIAKDTKKKFIVSAGGSITEVLGTHFNVNAYNDDNGTRITLLEGSVKILRSAQDDKAVVLKPGQQGQITNIINVVNNADVEQVMSWKNGWFEFDQTDLNTIMRQVSRWYDVDVVYQGKQTAEKFGGRISKNLPLSSVLQMLESNGVAFRLEGKKLIVIP